MILRTENLSKNYGSVKAVIDANFSLEKGQVHAIIGANGAGKSTFVKLLFGEILPTSGKIFIKGKQQKINSPGKAMRNGIAMISQDFGLINSMTVAENLAINIAGERKPVLFKSNEVKSFAKKILSKLSLRFNVDDTIENLSVSEKQLVAIAKALSIQSEILIFDEPTSVLGSNSFTIIKDLIKELKETKKSIIYITHKIDEVFEIADIVSVFRDGKIELTSRTDQILKKDLLLYFNIPKQEVPDKLTEEIKNPLLSVTELSTTSVKNISFSVGKGEIVGIISDNNSHAVELAKAIYGLSKKISGSIKINNNEVNSEPYKNIKQQIGFIPEDRRIEGIFNDLTVNDNIGLLQFKKTSKGGVINKELIEQNTIQKIKSLGIRCKTIFQPALELSGGNQQKVLFARWMSYDFDLLILIEPTAGIDLGGKSEIYSIIFDLRNKGKSFIIVSSDNDEIKNLSDRIISLNEYSVSKA